MANCEDVQVRHQGQARDINNKAKHHGQYSIVDHGMYTKRGEQRTDFKVELF